MPTPSKYFPACCCPAEEAVNTMQELKKEERSQVILFFPYSYMLCWLVFSPQMWPYESIMNTVWVYLG